MSNLKYSIGEPGETGLSPIRVDWGTYKGTVFTFKDMKVNEDGVLSFSTVVNLAMKNGQVVEEVKQFNMQKFNDEVSTPIMLEVIKDSTGEASNDN